MTRRTHSAKPEERHGNGNEHMAVEEDAATVRAAGGSRVRLRPLCERRDGDGWVIGRIETGDFIAVPEVAHRVVTLLGECLAIDDIADRLRAETGTSFAVADFVTALDELGFVAAVDGRARPKVGRGYPATAVRRSSRSRRAHSSSAPGSAASGPATQDSSRSAKPGLRTSTGPCR